MAKHVMIVDDDQSNVDFLSTVLKKHGYDSSSARDGQEGLELLQASKPDLLVLDVMMPRKSGFILFKELKKDDALKDLPVIMLTAVASVMAENKAADSSETIGEMKEAMQEKMEQLVDSFRSEGDIRPEVFLDKPIDPDGFIAEVRKLIG